jgi:hypothetical protein
MKGLFQNFLIFKFVSGEVSLVHTKLTKNHKDHKGVFRGWDTLEKGYVNFKIFYISIFLFF